MRPLRRVLMPVLFVILAITPAYRATAPVPAQLSDQAFWELIESASEPDGGFISENLVSNELGYPYVIPALLETAKNQGAYIGVGPEQNFSYVAALRPRIAFIVDIRRQNMIEHLLYKALFELSENRTEFISRLFARQPTRTPERDAAVQELFNAFVGLPESPELFAENLKAVRNLLITKHAFRLSADDEQTLEHVYEEFSRQGTQSRYGLNDLFFVNGVPVALVERGGSIRFLNTPVDGAAVLPPDAQPVAGAQLDTRLGRPFPTYAEVMAATDADGKEWSYLATEANYQAVRELQLKNLIVPLVGDFAGAKALRAVARYLREHEAVVSVFYVSNVEQYLTPLPKLQSFYANIAALPLDASSTFIRSAQMAGPQPGLAQLTLNPMQLVLEAVEDGRVRGWSDIFQLTPVK